MTLIETFYQYRNHARAGSMSAYMRQKFAFLGLDSATRRDLQKKYIMEMSDEPRLHRAFVLELWRLPEREFQYAAVDYLTKNRAKLERDDIFFLKKLIEQKSWWDTVDLLSSNIVGDLCLRYPELIESVMIPWSTSDNVWLRRTSILFMLKWKTDVDATALWRILENNAGHADFFIRKAMGWMLREYRKTNPLWVDDLVEQVPLSALTVREALKHVERVRT
ncbi:MAG: DNA alkylation repair protein [Bacilli bacterium]